MSDWLAAIGSWRRRAAWLAAGVAIAVIGVMIPLPLGPVLIRMQGSNTIGSELAPDLVLGFLRSQTPGELSTGIDAGFITLEAPDGARPLQFDIGSAGSDTAFQCGVDIAMSSRPIQEDEAERLKACDGERNELILASDAVAVVAHPGVGLSEISVEDLRRVFLCEVRDWSALGLPAGPITVLGRNDDSGTADVFRDRVLNDLRICSEAQEFEDSQELSERVAQTPGAIGFVGLPFVGTNSVAAVASGPDAASIVPTEENVRSGTYPLSRSLYLYTAESAPPVVEEFLSYVRGCDGQQRVDDDGFFRGHFLACETPLPENGSVPPSFPGTPCPHGAPADYCAFVVGATRFPFAVRFDTDSGAVDDRGRQDLAQFVELLRGVGGGRTVLLAGFTDAEGNPAHNEELARQRAAAVAAELRGMELSGVELSGVEVGGFGERFLVDDNSEAGQERNRRVEVWVR